MGPPFRLARASASAFTFASCMAWLGPRPAQATTLEIGGTLTADFNAGADTLLTLQFEDGSFQDISAGNGVGLAFEGGAIFFDDQSHQLHLVSSLGLKYSTMQPAENADLSFVRIPIELLAFYRNPELYFRVGGGAIFSPYNGMSGSGAAQGVDLEFEPALGGILQADFLLNVFSAGLRYTRLTYTTADTGADVDAHAIGVQLGVYHHLGDD